MVSNLLDIITRLWIKLYYLKRRIFPWSCTAMLLRGLIKDVSPRHIDNKSCVTTNTIITEETCVSSSKDQNGETIHQQLARRISSERKP